MTYDEFASMYASHVVRTCDGTDCYPIPAMIEDAQGQLTTCALAIEPDDVLRWAKEQARNADVRRLAFGLDRTARPGQGTTLENVFTYCVVERGGQPRFGFVEYDGKGDARQHDLVKGEFWYDIMNSGVIRDVLRHIAAEWWESPE